MLRSKFVSQSSLLRTIPGERASKVARKMSPPRGGDISIWENWGHFNLGLTLVNRLTLIGLPILVHEFVPTIRSEKILHCYKKIRGDNCWLGYLQSYLL